MFNISNIAITPIAYASSGYVIFRKEKVSLTFPHANAIRKLHFHLITNYLNNFLFRTYITIKAKELCFRKDSKTMLFLYLHMSSTMPCLSGRKRTHGALALEQLFIGH